MSDARALQLFLGRRLPQEVLELIFSLGFHLWLREPWSVLARAKEMPVIAIERPLRQLFDLELEGAILRRLCEDYEHDGEARGFRIARGSRALVVVPLRWHTLSIVSPRALRDDVVIDGEPWRPDGYKTYLKRALRGLEDIAFIDRPHASPHRKLEMSGARYHPPVLDSSEGDYRPESAEAWLQRRAHFARFYYHREGSETSWSSDEELEEPPEPESPTL
ncbi:MAG: hypothetical protein B7Z80_26040 [Rhodospirillales bacterium 20-64-7]|nr:MAG: hypothetical protein B7Z80_26040 [Rhodospirillales bacterium 20-64-7]